MEWTTADQLYHHIHCSVCGMKWRGILITKDYWYKCSYCKSMWKWEGFNIEI